MPHFLPGSVCVNQAVAVRDFLPAISSSLALLFGGLLTTSLLPVCAKCAQRTFIGLIGTAPISRRAEIQVVESIEVRGLAKMRHHTQNPPTFGSWGFDSPCRHQPKSLQNKRLAGASSPHAMHLCSRRSRLCANMQPSSVSSIKLKRLSLLTKSCTEHGLHIAYTFSGLRGGRRSSPCHF